MKEKNPKSKIQNPESRIQNPKSTIHTQSRESGDAVGRGRRLGFVRIIPGSEMRRAQILSFTAAEASRILLGARSRILTPAEFCSGLRRIRVGGTRIQNPKSEPLRRWTGLDFEPESRIHIPGPVCSARMPSRIQIPGTVTLQNFDGTGKLI